MIINPNDWKKFNHIEYNDSIMKYVLARNRFEKAYFDELELALLAHNIQESYDSEGEQNLYRINPFDIEEFKYDYLVSMYKGSGNFNAGSNEEIKETYYQRVPPLKGIEFKGGNYHVYIFAPLLKESVLWGKYKKRLEAINARAQAEMHMFNRIFKRTEFAKVYHAPINTDFRMDGILF